MMRTRALPTLLAAGLATLAGGADTPTAVAPAPLAPRDPARSLSAGETAAARHLVRVDASSDAFAAAVAGLGGTVDYHPTPAPGSRSSAG